MMRVGEDVENPVAVVAAPVLGVHPHGEDLALHHPIQLFHSSDG